MWTEYTPANLERVPTCPGVFAVRSKSKGRVVFIGRAGSDLRRSLSDTLAGLAGEQPLNPKATSDPTIKYDHVYQHNQTDLEFDLVRDSVLLDGGTLAAFLIQQLRPDYNSLAPIHPLPRRVGAASPLGSCPCCGKPW